MATNLVNKYNLKECKPKKTPLNVGVKLTQDNGHPLDKTVYGYSELVGSLLYLAVCTRPDIAQAVGALTRFMSKPSTEHWTAAKGVLRYIAGTLDFGITYSGVGSSPLVGFCDADYAGDLDTRRSTTGYMFTFNGGAVSWSSRLQATVAVSTTEAEYMAAAHATKEGLWLRKLLLDFNVKQPTLEIFCDNQATIKLVKHPVASQRSKHIDVIYHFVRERVQRKEIVFTYIDTANNVADILTKPLPEGKFKTCLVGMGVG
jgi:hypothetical protein